MKVRYQMRGLAVGIIVTALLMGIATDEGRPLTDAEIRAAAAELGMVESDSLKLTDLHNQTAKPSAEPTKPPVSEPVSESTDEPTKQPVSEPTEESTNVPVSEPTAEPAIPPVSEPTAEPTKQPVSEPTDEPTKQPVSEPTEEPSDKPIQGTVQITINPGETSNSVSKTLAMAGLVSDADAYDKYLCNYGFSLRIAVGTFEIPSGAGEEEIARIITRTN